MNQPTRTSERLLLLLKTRGELTTRQLAERLGVSVPAVRQHLAALGDEVSVRVHRSGVGRPAQVWSLAPAAGARFPDTHSELTVELIDVIETTLGQSVLDTLVNARSQRVLERYRAALAPCRSLDARLVKLAELRTAEGYLAQLERIPRPRARASGRAAARREWLLIENHCPICAAAERCQGFCRNELELFREVLGAGTTVERQDYLLAGARRCAYRVTGPADG